VFLIGAGSLVVGVALMVAARRWLPAFFTVGALPALAGDPNAAAPGGSPSAKAVAPSAAALEGV
jgi:hypothetical protein